MRVAFFGTYPSTRYPFLGALESTDGMPRAARRGLSGILELYEETGNKGNMVHGEAPGRIVACDRSRSAYVSVKGLVELGWSPERITECLNREFDLVVYSTANAVRPNVNPGCTAQVLDGLTCDFIVLGMGIQNELPGSTDVLHPNLVSLLDVCNRKARLFGVRGLHTQQWLRARGYAAATAVGCPSFFVYPHNLLRLPVPRPDAVRRVMAAGYIYGQVPRAIALLKVLEHCEAHYVMQEEIPALVEGGWIVDSSDLYDDATGEVEKSIIDSALSRVHARQVSFASYRWFQDPNAWRSFASTCDVYIGDRLHGGVVAMQAAVPALLMAEDLRVRELAEFFDLPAVSTADMKGLALGDLVAHYLSGHALARFKETYFARATDFERVLRDAGVELTASVTRPVTLQPPSRPTGAEERHRVSPFRRLLTRLRHV